MFPKSVNNCNHMPMWKRLLLVCMWCGMPQVEELPKERHVYAICAICGLDISAKEPAMWFRLRIYHLKCWDSEYARKVA